MTREDGKYAKYFIGYNNSDEIRQKSTSGGIFYSIACYVINNGGVVFGVKFDEKFNVIHSKATNIKDIDDFIGSKYVQSNKLNVFREVYSNLKNEKLVLFSGTPCEIYGLKAFLKKEYNNLICIDLLCHGAPSPLVWEKYLNEFGISNIKSINFRSKISGWLKSSMNINTINGEYIKVGRKDPYISLFNNGFSMRESCYWCNFKNLNRISDITLGDFWGVKDMYPKLFDNKGISLIFCSTSKGISILEQLSKEIFLQEVKYEDIIYNNGSIGMPMKCPENRNEFFNEIKQSSLKELAKKYVKEDYFLLVKNVCKNILKKLKLFELMKKTYRNLRGVD